MAQDGSIAGSTIGSMDLGFVFIDIKHHQTMCCQYLSIGNTSKISNHRVPYLGWTANNQLFCASSRYQDFDEQFFTSWSIVYPCFSRYNLMICSVYQLPNGSWLIFRISLNHPQYGTVLHCSWKQSSVRKYPWRPSRRPQFGWTVPMETYTDVAGGFRSTYSYGHLPVISGYKWDYTFYKWGFVSTYNW